MVLSGKPPECGCGNARKGRVGAAPDSSAAKPRKRRWPAWLRRRKRSPRARRLVQLMSRKAAKDSTWRLFLPPLRGLAVVAVTMTVGCARAYGTRQPTAVFFCRFAARPSMLKPARLLYALPTHMGNRAYTINAEALKLYFFVGGCISKKTRNAKWGTGAIDALSERLQVELPGLRGFSAMSIRYMRFFFEAWASSPEIQHSCFRHI